MYMKKYMTYVAGFIATLLGMGIFIALCIAYLDVMALFMVFIIPMAMLLWNLFTALWHKCPKCGSRMTYAVPVAHFIPVGTPIRKITTLYSIQCASCEQETARESA